MGHSNGVITTTQLSVEDVQVVLGASTSDIGMLCKHDNVNMWAKYKPVKYPHVVCNGTSGGKHVENWKGWDNGNPYGIVTPSVEEGDVFDEAIVTTAISYQKPTGGSQSPYRLGDFRGYDHNAIAPYAVNLPSGTYPQNQGMIRMQIDKYVRGSSQMSEGNLTFDEIFAGYLPCLVVKKGSEYVFRTINEGDGVPSLKYCPLWGTVGDMLNVYACAASKATNGWVNDKDGIALKGILTNGIVVSTEVTVGPAVEDTYTASVVITGISCVISAVAQYSASNIVIDCRIKGTGTMGRYAEYLLEKVKVKTTNNDGGALIGEEEYTSGGSIGSLTITKSSTTFQITIPASYRPSKGSVESANYDIVCTFTPQGNPISGGGSGGGGAIN